MSMVENLKDTLGISCVEVYLLALMREAGMEERSLYVGSFVEPQTVIEDFLSAHCNFTTYAGLERLQRIAIDQSVADLRYFVGEETPLDPRESIVSEGKIAALLKGVRPDYKQSKLMPWRDDHYVLRHEGKVYDCYPPSEINELATEYYDGRNIRVVLNKKRCADASESASVIRNDVQALKTTIKRYEYRSIAFEIGQNIPYLRDALLIVKVSRRRINRILHSEIIEEEIAELGKLIALLEICRLRGRAINAEANVYKINTLEKEWRACAEHG